MRNGWIKKKKITKKTTNLTFPTESPEKFVGLKFGFLVWHHSGHFENKSRLRLLVKAYGIKRHHPRKY